MSTYSEFIGHRARVSITGRTGGSIIIMHYNPYLHLWIATHPLPRVVLTSSKYVTSQEAVIPASSKYFTVRGGQYHLR